MSRTQPAVDRRTLLKQGGRATAVGLAVPAALAGFVGVAADDASARDLGDAPVIVEAIALEETAILAYSTILGSARIGGSRADLIRRLMDHERRHAAALKTVLEGLGGIPPRRRSTEDIEITVPGLTDVTDPREMLVRVLALEEVLERRYRDFAARVVDRKVLLTMGSIAASEGGHATALRRELGRPAL